MHIKGVTCSACYTGTNNYVPPKFVVTCQKCSGAILEGEGMWAGKVCNCPPVYKHKNYCPNCGHKL